MNKRNVEALEKIISVFINTLYKDWYYVKISD